MSQPTGSQYKEIVKQVFTSSKNDGNEIKTKFVKEVDPIVQSSAKFQNKNPQMSKTTKEYYEYTSPKDERLHRKVDYKQSKIFFENEAADKERPKKRVINENCYQHNEPKKGIKVISANTTSSNPIAHTTNQLLPIQRLAKKNMHRPSDSNTILQEPNTTELFKASAPSHYNPSLVSNNIFKEGSKINNFNKCNPYTYEKNSALFNTDHVVDIFNSKINEKVKEQKITQKPNADNYSTFVNEAREICYDRYQDYY